MPVRTSSYYAAYHGHDVEHLEELLPVLRMHVLIFEFMVKMLV